MFENIAQPLISSHNFLLRITIHILLSIAVAAFSLIIGIIGYHHFEDLPWIDSLLNASMILGGMGPVNILTTNGGKIFASFYALFSGIIFLVIMGIIIAPILHRFLHRFHFDNKI